MIRKKGEKMNNNSTQNNIYDRRAERRLQRMGNRSGSWGGGLLLIGLGALFLLQNSGAISWGRWWSLLILIPAIAAFTNSWKEYKVRGGQFTSRAIGSLISGLLLVMVMSAIMFNMDWGWVGPALLLLAGLVFLVRGYSDQKRG